MTVLQFTITVTGELTDIRIIRSSGSTVLDNEAVRVVSDSPAWEPGSQDGIIKNTTLVFPVIFESKK
jgi:protein TonB